MPTFAGRVHLLRTGKTVNTAQIREATMATDYDAPRKSDDEAREDSLEELKSRRNDKNSGKVDEDEAEVAETFELPGAGELVSLTGKYSNRQFFVGKVCAGCFLVKPRSQLAETRGGKMYCVDCV